MTADYVGSVVEDLDEFKLEDDDAVVDGDIEPKDLENGSMEIDGSIKSSAPLQTSSQVAQLRKLISEMKTKLEDHDARIYRVEIKSGHTADLLNKGKYFSFKLIRSSF